jgi:hypothetical protein
MELSTEKFFTDLPHKKATEPIALNEPAAHDLHGFPTERPAVRFLKYLRLAWWPHHQKAVLHSQPKMMIEHVGKFLHLFATAIDHLAHSANVGIPKDISTE